MRSRVNDKPKLVIIDDEGDFLTLMEHSLKTLYQVTSLYGSEWTYAQVAALEPDLILLDVHMPAEGGFDICRQLRADPRFLTTPILFLTGSETSDDFKRHLKAGGTRFLHKGLERRELLAALGEELANSRRERDCATSKSA
jgi:DNA-binding response OmpR family regulator